MWDLTNQPVCILYVTIYPLRKEISVCHHAVISNSFIPQGKYFCTRDGRMVYVFNCVSKLIDYGSMCVNDIKYVCDLRFLVLELVCFLYIGFYCTLLLSNTPRLSPNACWDWLQPPRDCVQD